MDLALHPRFTAQSAHANGVSALVFNAGRVYSASKDAQIKEWDADSFQLIRVFSGHSRWIRCLALGNGRLFSASWDNSVREWDLETGLCVRVFEGVHESGVNSVLVDEANIRLYSASEDRIIAVYDLNSGEVIDRWEASGGIIALHHIQLNGDLGYIAAASDNGTIGLWDASSGELVDSSPSSSNEVTSLFLTAGRLFSAGNDKLVTEWDVSSMVKGRTFRGHSAYVSCLTGTEGESEGVPGGPRLFSGGWDGSVKVWDLVTGVCIASLRIFEGRSVNSICLGDDGLLVTGGSNGDIKFWNLHDIPPTLSGTVGQALPQFPQSYRPPPVPVSPYGQPGMYSYPGPYGNQQPPYGGGQQSSGGYQTSSYGSNQENSYGGSTGGRPPCHFFARGQCRNGDNCRFSHSG